MFLRLSRWFRHNRPSAPPNRSRSNRAWCLEPLEARTLLSGPEITILDAVTPISSGSAAVINLGSVSRGDAGPTRTFTLRNDGDSRLTVSSLGLPVGFSLVDAPHTTLVARSSDTFTVQLDSGTAGVRSGQVLIGSNDADEGTFAFSISGTVVPNGPEIAILLGDTPVIDGSQAAIAWPGVIVGETGPDRTFTVKNEGNQSLAISSITLPQGFTLIGSLPATVAPLASDTFTVRLLSASTGAKSGQVHLVSNDPDIGSFDFPITGLVTATAVPSLVVLDGPLMISSGTPAIDFGKVIKDQTGPSHTLTVRNDGTAALSLNSLNVPTGFNVIGGLVPSLDPAESDTFIVQLDSAVIAVREGDLSIGSNDPSASTFQLHITGNVVANAPEIRVFHDDQEIASGAGAAFEFDPVSQGKPGSMGIFTVANFGAKDLALGAITVTAGFKLLTSLPAILPADTFTALVVQLDSKVPGTKTGEISFITNDADENPFRILITGTVQESEPEITVSQQGKNLTDGTTTPLAFGDGNLGRPGPTRTFTVRNQGRGSLAIGALTVPAGFTVVKGLASTLAPRASDTFVVQLNTTVLGDYSGDISLVTNDADENPFNFSIRSRVAVAPAPQLVVRQGDTELTSGDSMIDLGSVAFRRKGSSISLAIRNDGNADLNLLSVELPSGFVAKKPPKRVAPQRTVVFQLRLDSRVVGSHTGQLIIHSDDASDPSFAIDIQGTVLG